MSFPRYERYKDSGVEWLGEVPEHWRIAPLYSLGKEREESNVGLISNNLLSLSYGRIIEKDIETSDGLLPESFETYQIVHPGDIIFRLTDLQNDKRSLRTAIVTQLGIITFAYAAFEPRAIMPAYLSYLLRDYDLRKIFYSMGGGVRQSMKFDDIRRLPTLVPSKNEQSTIVKFLDYETAKIDALIEEQRRLIELLKEKRQAVISDAVTKGLNFQAQMRDSGMEWLGSLPEIWQLTPLKWRSRCTSGLSLAPNDFSSTASDDKFIPVIGGNGLMGYTNKTNISAPVLVVGRVGALCGNVHVINSSSWVTDNALIIQIDMKTFVPEFLAHVLRVRNLNEIAAKTAQPLITGTQVKDQRIPTPTLSEQQEIVDFIDAVANRLQMLEKMSSDSIVLLEERRSALISAAVTGKIDVRNYTPKEIA